MKMKKLVSAMLILCLVIALLPVVAVRAEAAGGPEKTLQMIYYYDYQKEVLLDECTTGVLVKNGSSNYVITTFPSKEDQEIYTAFTTEKDEMYICIFLETINKHLYLYEANSKLGEADGFTQLGEVTEGETVYLILGWDEDGNKGGYTTMATGLKDGVISLELTLDQLNYPIPVLNSKNEVCAVYYGEYCYSLITDEETFYANSKPSETQPPATNPPATNPPATNPPATEPSATNPPATNPPATNPPATESPAKEQTTEEYGLPVDLPDLDQLYADAVVQKKTSMAGTIAVGGICILVVILLIAVIIVKRRNKMKINAELNEADEGTVLADVPVDTGLRLQFSNGKSISVSRGFTIGRAPDNDIVVPKTSSSVSGRHCEIVVQNGAAYLRDLGSTNGTFINGRRLAAGQLVQLLPGMTVGLGTPNGKEAFVVVHGSK